MLRFSHRTLVSISGAIWFALGAWLLPLGLNFLVKAAKGGEGNPILQFLGAYVGGLENATVVLLACALFAGYLKGRKVLGKAAEKGCLRIYKLENPAPLVQIYKPGYYLLLGSMVFLGILAKMLPLDLRGFMDTAIGAALINGSMVYFKNALTRSFVIGGPSGDFKSSE